MPNTGSLPGGSPRAGNGSLDPRSSGSPTNTPSQPSTSDGTMRGGLQLGPPGRWWDDKHYVKALHLRPEQQKRMDGLFDENRAMLVSRFQTLQQEQSKMEALSRASNLDEATLFSQIDRVAQARADLEKANTHLTLQVRKEMDADQVSRLDKDR
jgi:Spy/CpxP family protein refolding chaperone